MEGYHFVKSGKLVDLSEQQLVDCDKDSHACNGGSKTRAFSYAESHKMEKESDYPYKSGDGSTHSCHYSSTKGVVSVSNYYHVTKDSASQLKSAISRHPVAVSVNAHESVFKHYTGGIITSSSCGTSTDHSVTAVGYGSDYYLVKNSWGKSWGESGYVRIGI